MRKITQFIGKEITVDGIVGTIYKDPFERSNFCEFIYRDGGAIISIRMAGNHVMRVDENNYQVREKYSEIYGYPYSKRHYEFIESWGGSFPSGDYFRRDTALKEARL